MSNLAAQFISQSYQSVINVGTGSGANLTSTLQPLTDGYGTVSPISVSTTDVAINGNLSVTGSIIPFSTSSVSGAYDLGSPSKPWRHLYVSSGSVYLDGNRVMGLTNDTNNLHFIAPTGSQIQMGTNVFFQNPEVTLNPGLIFEATGPETGSSIYFNGGKGQIVSEGDLSFLLLTGDTNNNPSASFNVSVGNIISGSINLFGKHNSQITIDKDGNIGLTTVSSSLTQFTNSGSITALHGEYNGGLQIQSGLMELYQNDLGGGVTITSQSIVISANQTSSLFEVNMVQGQIALLSEGDLNLSSSLGTVNTWGTASVIGSMNVINGPLNVSSSSDTPFAINVYNDGIYSQGYIQSDGGYNAIGTSPFINLMSNENFSGSQYPIANAFYDSGSYPADIFAGWQVVEAGSYLTAVGIAANSYAPEYYGQLAGWFGGGGNNISGSNTAIILPMSNGTMQVYKDTYFNTNATIAGTLDVSYIQSTGSINLWAEGGNTNVTGALHVSGSGTYGLDVKYSGIYTEGALVSRGTIASVNEYNEINIQSNLDGSGSFFANFNAKTNASGSDVFSGFNIPTYGSGQDMGMVMNAYTGEYYGTAVGMIYAGGNNNDGSSTAIVFPADGTMQVFKDTTFNKNVSTVGYTKSSNSYIQAALSANQSLTNGVDTKVTFDLITANNNGWFNTTTNEFQPTVAGTYKISFSILMDQGSGNGQMNAQVNKNGTTQLYINQTQVNNTQPQTVNGSVLVELNGTTDYVYVTFYTSHNGHTIQSGSGTNFIAELL